MNLQQEMRAAFAEFHRSIEAVHVVLDKLQANLAAQDGRGCEACSGTGVVILDGPGETGSGEHCIEVRCDCDALREGK